MVFQMYGENLNQFIHTFIFKNLKKIKLIFYEFMIYKKLFWSQCISLYLLASASALLYKEIKIKNK
jgi:hypothetical protein